MASNKDIRMSASEIQSFRKSLGLTQEELAKKLGVSQESVSQWENKKKQPSRPVLLLLDRLKSDLSEVVRNS